MGSALVTCGLAASLENDGPCRVLPGLMSWAVVLRLHSTRTRDRSGKDVPMDGPPKSSPPVFYPLSLFLPHYLELDLPSALEQWLRDSAGSNKTGHWPPSVFDP
jgi:hypothetical protein